MKRLITLCCVLTTLVSSLQAEWIWYPGMLAAYRQVRQKAMSKERCVNVDYPGRFFECQSKCLFRKSPKSRVIEVNTTDGTLPALFIQDGSAKNWQVSLDGKTWVLAESDSRCNNPNIRPDVDREITVPVKPVSYIPLRQVSVSSSVVEMGSNGCLLVDFHTLEMGNVVLTAEGEGSLSFIAGESQEEAMEENPATFEQKPLPPVTLTGSRQQIELPEYALRYLKIRSTDHCKVSDIVFNTKMWPVEQQMTFESDDPRMNRLFQAGVETLHTSMHNFYLDGIKRDYLPWAMDAVASTFGGDYAFGDQQLTRNSISIALMRPNPSVDDWGIVDYPLHALLGLEEDYLRYGDLRTSLMFRDRIEQQISLYEANLNGQGFIVAPKESSGFIPGWNRKNGPEDYGTAAYAQMLLYMNFKIAARFATRWGEKAKAKHYQQVADSLGNRIISAFWDKDRKVFVNGYTEDGQRDERISHQAQIMGVLAGLYPQSDYDLLFDRILPSLPHYCSDVSYEKGYDCLAYAKAGKVREMFLLLNKVWGRWLDEGYLRYPENFSVNAPLSQQLSFYARPFGLSLCHGANGVPPILGVLKGIYGFSQSETDINSYTIKPQLLHLKWAKGRIPTHNGYITLSLNKQGKSCITIPAGCKVTLVNGGASRILKQAGTYEFDIQIQ